MNWTIHQIKKEIKICYNILNLLGEQSDQDLKLCSKCNMVEYFNFHEAKNVTEKILLYRNLLSKIEVLSAKYPDKSFIELYNIAKE